MEPRARNLSRGGAFDRHRPAAARIQPLDEGGRIRAHFGRIPNTVFAPDGFVAAPEAADRPRAELRLDYAHGYNGDVAGSLHWISAGEFVFPLACVAVVQRLEPPRQRHFLGHSAAITCLAYSEASKLCASGQRDPKGATRPFVCVWSPDDCEPRAVLVFHEARVLGVGFSPTGDAVFTFGGGESQGYILAVWTDFLPDVVPRMDKAGRLPRVSREPSCRASAGKVPAYAIAMSGASMAAVPAKGKTGDAVWQLAMYDAGLGGKPGSPGLMLQFWSCRATSDGALELQGKSGVFGGAVGCRPRQALHCSWSTFSSRPRCFVCGDNGLLYIFENGEAVWQRRVCSEPLGFAVEVHDSCLFLSSRTDAVFYFGGLSGDVEDWLTSSHLRDAGGALVCATAQLQPNSVAICSVGPQAGRLALVGTRNHHLLLMDLSQRRLLRTVTVSHQSDTRALCLCSAADLQLLATGSSDGTLRLWDLERLLPVVGRVLSFGPAQGIYGLAFRERAGDLLAMGHADGHVRVISFPGLQPVFKHMASKAQERIADVCFTPSGDLLAAASWDQTVYVYAVQNPPNVRSDSSGGTAGGIEVLPLHKIMGNTSSVTRIQFTEDGQFLMTNSKDKQLLYFSMRAGEQQAISSLRNATWAAPWRCPCGWPTIGLWAANADSDIPDILSCCSFMSQVSVLCSGDDCGRVQLCQFPAVSSRQEVRTYRGHDGHITGVLFIPALGNGRPPLVATLGGDDRAVFFWAVRDLGRESPRVPRHRPWVDPEPHRCIDKALAPAESAHTSANVTSLPASMAGQRTRAGQLAGSGCIERRASRHSSGDPSAGSRAGTSRRPMSATLPRRSRQPS